MICPSTCSSTVLRRAARRDRARIAASATRAIESTPPAWTADEALLALLGSPNLGSRASVYRRYDHQVGDATVILPGGDAALVRVDGTPLGLALATDGNSRYTALDARQGAMIAVCEAARNVVATGAQPAAITNCLNFANPEHADVWWDLHDAIEGISEACKALDIPVVSGNVSLYNDTGGTGIDPTVVIGMVGVIDDVARRCTAGFRGDGDVVGAGRPVSRGTRRQRVSAARPRGQCRRAAASSISTSSAACRRSSSRRSARGCCTPRTTAPRAGSRSHSPSRVCWAT